MPERIMYVQLKTGFNTDRGPAWITRLRFSKSWQTAYFRGRTLERYGGFDSNFYGLDTGEEFWISGPKRDRTDVRYSSQQPEIEEDVRAEYEAFLNGAPLPGRENG
ncbi:hypothetical protein [Arthrobacter globiformis]|uniref:hypothetical protein n=1 Tax=Arthrobacter globiformis TaxID=1665 RepID=UPI002793E1A7|nr:hypothetical protein [Arthrobacter globiformis]MDQ0619213.1 hypothetical protein [Arthrobacter globiformis]